MHVDSTQFSQCIEDGLLPAQLPLPVKDFLRSILAMTARGLTAPRVLSPLTPPFTLKPLPPLRNALEDSLDLHSLCSYF